METIPNQQETTRKFPQPLEAQVRQTPPVNKPMTDREMESVRTKKLEAEQISQSDFLKIASGDQLEVYFDIDNPDTGPRTDTFKQKDGTEKESRRYQFVLYNHKIGREQRWTCAPQWAAKVYQAIEDFSTKNLVIRRKGAGMSDTSYDFLPTSFKKAG